MTLGKINPIGISYLIFCFRRKKPPPRSAIVPRGAAPFIGTYDKHTNIKTITNTSDLDV